jgi:cytochrome c oxidase accessory protein FixG
MARVSAADRQRQLLLEEAGQHLYANRVRVYPKAVDGPVRRAKWAILIACLAIYYLLPWLRWDRGPGRPNQAVLLDIGRERFYFFWLEFWPQDIHYLTGLLIAAAVTLFLVTSLFGRLWCGYTCPQTVWTDLFMWIERRIEGDRNARMKRDAGPVNFDLAWRKVAKHAAWLFIAFWTGGAWIMYYADAPTVTVEFWSGTAATPVYVFTALFTFTTYTLAGWAREQVCTYMCPWPRFQAAMLDEQSYTVTYQGWRGEPRGKHRKQEAGQKLGDCVDCGACVAVCPTGIDIRDGSQLECINCGLCIDACNHVMARTGAEKWLITWDTLAHQRAKAEGREVTPRWLRPRTMIYGGVLTVVLAVMAVALWNRPLVELSVQHDRAPLFVRMADGSYRNAYTVRVANKTRQDARFELTVKGLPGLSLALAEGQGKGNGQLILPVPLDTVGTFRVLLSGRPERMGEGSLPVDFVLRDAQSGEETTYRAAFMGPPDRGMGR